MFIDWNAVTAIATVISMVAFVLTALYVRAELKSIEQDRYLSVTSELFSIWQSKEFMDAQLWLLHRLEETTWEDFIDCHRADVGEVAFHRVGAFYDRVGTLVRMGLINKEEMLATIGAHAIAVWQKIQPLVHEARRREHSTLYTDFERMLPSCYECYVPALGLSVGQPMTSPPVQRPSDLSVSRISIRTLHRLLDQSRPLTLIDTRHPTQAALDPRTLPGATLMPADDILQRYDTLPPKQRVVVYCA